MGHFLIHFCSFLILSSVDSLFNQSPLDGMWYYFDLLLWLIMPQWIILYVNHFVFFFQYNFGLGSKKEDTELSNIGIYNFAKYFWMSLEESLVIGPFCIPTIKVRACPFPPQPQKQSMLKLNKNVMIWWVINGTSVKFSWTVFFLTLNIWESF